MYKSNKDSYPLYLTDLTTPPDVYIKSIPTDPKTNLDYILSPFPGGCAGTVSYPCTSYSIVANLESGATYSAGPYGAVIITPTPGAATATPVLHQRNSYSNATPVPPTQPCTSNCNTNST